MCFIDDRGKLRLSADEGWPWVRSNACNEARVTWICRSVSPVSLADVSAVKDACVALLLKDDSPWKVTTGTAWCLLSCASEIGFGTALAWFKS